MSRKVKLTMHPNGVFVKGKNKRIIIIKDVADKNRISIRSLTSETGKGVGAISQISKNGKTKCTIIGLSDEGLMLLYKALEYHINRK